MNVARYYHTLRHLRPVQVYDRVTRNLYRPRPDMRRAPPARTRSGTFLPVPARAPSMLAPDRFVFLNVARELRRPDDWNAAGVEKLWLYNLHYFDDLQARDRDDRKAWHLDLMRRWIAENPPGRGNGWEPYPLSLRIVNWTKWMLSGHVLPPQAMQSLAVQARFLAGRLEYHLLGNHLWANGKALLFAGACFTGDEADHWLHQGMQILRAQLAEQVLGDGGHFERSPMYHALFVEDLLDVLALACCYPAVVAPEDLERLQRAATAMLGWLRAMTHPDGEIAFFNDAATAVAPRLAVLEESARALAVPLGTPAGEGLTMLEPSGYARMQMGDFVVLADVGPVGPDYLPGHAHADTLSFELSWRGRRILGNSGTSCYGTGAQRHEERRTGAHNTVAVDGEDSSEVWHGFRVARRARTFGLHGSSDGGRIGVECSHDGYTRLPGRPVHRRAWALHRNAGLHIRDEITGGGEHAAEGHLHVQPGIATEYAGPGRIVLDVPDTGRLAVTLGSRPAVEIRGGTFAPEFGRRLSRPVIVWRRSGPLPLTASVAIAPC